MSKLTADYRTLQLWAEKVGMELSKENGHYLLAETSAEGIRAEVLWGAKKSDIDMFLRGVQWNFQPTNRVKALPKEPERVLQCVLRPFTSSQVGKAVFRRSYAEGNTWIDIEDVEKPLDEFGCRVYAKQQGYSRISFDFGGKANNDKSSLIN